MRFNERRAAIAALISLTIVSLNGCSKGSTAASGGSCQGTGSGLPDGAGSLNPSCNASASFSFPSSIATNAMSISVDGSLCTAAGASGGLYPDEICASVTICTPGCDGQCQTINDVLLDTGSYGLRLFKSAITIPLKQVSNDGGNSAVAECVGFGDGSSEWGPVELADVKLANEPTATNVPIMVIDSTFSCAPAACGSTDSYPDTSPQEAGFNGILGVGLFQQDCGEYCTTDSGNGQYYSCENGVGCGGTTVALASQVTNPVSMLSQDNNGVILTLPSIASTGVPSVNGTSVSTGSLVLGIDTEPGASGSANNSSSASGPAGHLMTFLAADDQGNFRTTFQGQTMQAFIDSGSSDLAFATTGVADCSAHDQANAFNGSGSQFYCPNDTSPYSSPLAFPSVYQIGASGSPSVSANFDLMNAYYLLFIANSGENYAFSTIGGPTGGAIGGFFDWGLPFFFGKSVAVSMDGRSFSHGSGAGWAY